MTFFHPPQNILVYINFYVSGVSGKPVWDAGGRLNIKMSPYQYKDPHVKDKTVSRPSYL